MRSNVSIVYLKKWQALIQRLKISLLNEAILIYLFWATFPNDLPQNDKKGNNDTIQWAVTCVMPIITYPQIEINVLWLPAWPTTHCSEAHYCAVADKLRTVFICHIFSLKYLFNLYIEGLKWGWWNWSSDCSCSFVVFWSILFVLGRSFTLFFSFVFFCVFFKILSLFLIIKACWPGHSEL